MPKYLRIFMSTAILVLIFVSELTAQVSRRNDKVVRLAPDDAAQRWLEFSKSGIAADYCMTFKLAHIPRKADEIVWYGEIFGMLSDGKNLTRIRIWQASDPKNVGDYILISSPTEHKVWKAEGDKFVELPQSQWGKPLASGIIYAPFDFLLPYKSWKSSYDGAGRIGQAVHYFILTPPQNASESDIKKVRIGLSREFNSPAQVEIFGSNDVAMRTMSLGSVCKIDGLWTMRELSIRDDVTRDKDKLRFNAAKMRPILSPDIFNPKLPVSTPQRPILDAL